MLCNKRINKFMMDTTDTSPAEKTKCIKHYLPRLSLLIQGNLSGEAQIAFTDADMGNPSLGVPTLYLTLEGNHVSPEVCEIKPILHYPTMWPSSRPHPLIPSSSSRMMTRQISSGGRKNGRITRKSSSRKFYFRRT